MLLAACFVDNHPVVDFLIERGADLNGVSKFLGKTPLMMSLTKDTAQRLITAGANMNKTDQLGGTALMWQYDPAVMLQLISNGAKCKVVDRQRNGVVARTANNLLQLKTLRRGDFSKLKNLDANYAKVLKKMIAGGSGVDGRLPEHGMSPLMVMAKLDLSKSANLLLKAGANINATDRKGLMAWQHASAKSTLKKKLKPDK
jgi:ankyrin repeat protein